MNAPTRAVAKKKLFEKMDMATDKKKGIKEGTPADKKQDKKFGMAMFKKKAK